MTKTALVTGGAGFIGSHLCDYLLLKNHRVIAIDNLISGNLDNIRHIFDNDKFLFYNQDIKSYMNYDADQIFNLACPASPVHYQNNPLETIQTCIYGTMNALDTAKRYNSSVFQASTSEVYGDPLIHPQKESYWGNVNPIGSRSCYNEGKRCAETLCIEYKKAHNIDVKIGRIFNTYGPRMQENDGRVVSNFIVAALRNKPLNIFGDGLQTRSFCFIDDIVRGIYLTMNTSTDFAGPVNLGNPHEISILELAKNIISLTNSKSNIAFLEPISDDPHRRRPDISLANKKLRWEPTTSLDVGLKKSIDYFSKLLTI